MRLKQLVRSATGYLRDGGYTESTIYINYVRHWNALLKSVGDAPYSHDLVGEYLAKRFGRDVVALPVPALGRDEYRCRHALLELGRFHDDGAMGGTSMAGAAVRMPLDGASEEALRLYLGHLRQLEYSDSSMRVERFAAHAFLLACPVGGICDDAVLGYAVALGAKAKQTVRSELKRLRRFLRFLCASGLAERDYGTLLASPRGRRNTSIASVYSPAEVAALLNHLSTHGGNRSRNYAIALLVAVYGFRAGDVAKMRLSDIDWLSGTVTVVQSKTSARLVHGLTGLVRDALASYVLGERPDVCDGHVFLGGDGRPMAPTTVSTMIHDGFVLCGVDIDGRKHGSHSLRHSLASGMMERGVGILDIARVLGHGSADTTKNVYAKVDLGHLRLCELEVPGDE